MRERLLSKFRNSTLARNAGWMFIGQGISTLNQGIYFLVLARLLGLTQYGVLVGAGAVVSLVAQYGSLGFGYVFLRYVGQDRQQFSVYWGNMLLLTAVLGTVIVAGLYVAAPWLLRTTPVSLLVCLAIGECLCSQLTLCCGQVFQTYERMSMTATLNLLTNFVRMVLAVVLLVTMHHATAWQWGYVSVSVSSVTALSAVTIVLVRMGLPGLDLRLMRTRLGEGFVFAVSGSTTSAYNDLDKAMLGHYGMSAANGIYTMAYRVVDIMYIPIRSIHAAAFPRFFRYGAEGVDATERYARTILNKTLLFGLAGAAGMFFLAPVAPYLLGHSFAQSVDAIRWLCLIPLFRCFHLSAGDAMAGAGYQRYRLGGQSVAVAFNFGANLYLIPHFSWRGAAFASLLTDGGLGLLSWTILLALKKRNSGEHLLVPASTS
jgi:O-antigen/teichoic acid export membrane protein